MYVKAIWQLSILLQSPSALFFLYVLFILFFYFNIFYRKSLFVLVSRENYEKKEINTNTSSLTATLYYNVCVWRTDSWLFESSEPLKGSKHDIVNIFANGNYFKSVSQ